MMNRMMNERNKTMSYDNDDDDDDVEDTRKVEVGARVQKHTDDPTLPMGGVIESHEPAEMERPKEYWKLAPEDIEKTYEHFVIKWDDGSTERVQQYSVSLEDTEIERQYRKVAHEAGEKIDKLLAKAAKAISDAEEIADKYGVPFNSGVSPLSQSYFPSTTSELFPDLDSEFVNDVTGAYHSEYGEEGWQHSAVCY